MELGDGKIRPALSDNDSVKADWNESNLSKKVDCQSEKTPIVSSVTFLVKRPFSMSTVEASSRSDNHLYFRRNTDHALQPWSLSASSVVALQNKPWASMLNQHASAGRVPPFSVTSLSCGSIRKPRCLLPSHVSTPLHFANQSPPCR